MNQKDLPPDLAPAVEEWIEGQPRTRPETELSVVIPAFNELRRLPTTLIDIIDYLDSRPEPYEIIVVDDGSSDGTSDAVRKFEKIRSQVRLITLATNGGKGHAVKTGVLNAQGKRILFADADGAAPIQELPRLEAELNRGAACAYGSRAMKSNDTTISALWIRKLAGRTFNTWVNLLLLPGVADSQCGFKLFTREAATSVFPKLLSRGFAFDVELLYLVKKLGFEAIEVPINWSNVPGSKVNLFTDSMRMFVDVFRIKLRHLR